MPEFWRLGSPGASARHQLQRISSASPDVLTVRHCRRNAAAAPEALQTFVAASIHFSHLLCRHEFIIRCATSLQKFCNCRAINRLRPVGRGACELTRIGGTPVLKQRFTKLNAAPIWLTPGDPLIKSKLAKPSENRGVRCASLQLMGAVSTPDEPGGWRGHLSLRSPAPGAEDPVSAISLARVAVGAL